MNSNFVTSPPVAVSECEDIEAFAVIFVFDSYDWRTQSLLARNTPSKIGQLEEEETVSIGIQA